MKTIGLTQFGQNSLANKADYTIQTVKTIETDNQFISSSLHAQLIAIDVLFYAFLSKNYITSTERIKQSREEMDQYKKR